jgi:hypothetical protein
MRMTAKLYHFTLPPQILARGFWLYVWNVGLPNGSNAFYVGMTGDTGSYSAQSPFNRVSAHLGLNLKSNPLRKYLGLRGVDPEDCTNLDFTAYGPLYEVPTDLKDYQRIRRAERLERQAQSPPPEDPQPVEPGGVR